MIMCDLGVLFCRNVFHRVWIIKTLLSNQIWGWQHYISHRYNLEKVATMYAIAVIIIMEQRVIMLSFKLVVLSLLALSCAYGKFIMSDLLIPKMQTAQ